MAAEQGANIALAYKKQSGLGSAASGSGATGLYVRPSGGLAIATAEVMSRVLRRSKMKVRSRQGSNTVTANYETELEVGNGDGIFLAALGASSALATFPLTNSDLGSCTITGTGTTLTFGTAAVLSSGVVAGMMAKFTSM